CMRDDEQRNRRRGETGGDEQERGGEAGSAIHGVIGSRLGWERFPEDRSRPWTVPSPDGDADTRRMTMPTTAGGTRGRTQPSLSAVCSAILGPRIETTVAVRSVVSGSGVFNCGAAYSIVLQLFDGCDSLRAAWQSSEISITRPMTPGWESASRARRGRSDRPSRRARVPRL